MIRMRMSDPYGAYQEIMQDLICLKCFKSFDECICYQRGMRRIRRNEKALIIVRNVILLLCYTYCLIILIRLVEVYG